MNKIVSFSGHRYEWENIGVEEKVKPIIERLILDGYTTFYDGDIGAFDKICSKIIFEMKKKYEYIKIFKILTYYHENKNFEISSRYDGSIYPELENVYYKKIILEKNKWIIDNSDILICHINYKYKIIC